MKPKALRKLIQQHFKKVAVLSELECMFKFFDLLRAHYRFDQERFICALGVRFCSVNFESDQFLQRCLNFFFFLLQSSWSIPVELVIGPDLGISYMAHRGGTVVSIKLSLNNFTCVLSFVSINIIFAANENRGILPDTIYPNAGVRLQGTRKSLY